MLPRAMDSAIESWKGEHLTNVINQWGIPDREMPLGSGKRYKWHSPGCTRTLQVHDEIVTSGAWRGENCCIATIAGKCALMPNRAPKNMSVKP